MYALYRMFQDYYTFNRLSGRELQLIKRSLDDLLLVLLKPLYSKNCDLNDSGIPDIICVYVSLMFFSNYKPSTEEDHGQVLCWASNGLGEQIQPCVFRVVPLASPAPPKDCKVIQNTFFPTSIENFPKMLPPFLFNRLTRFGMQKQYIWPGILHKY